MSFSNKTVHLDLPQWDEDDKPTWLGDMNLAFIRVDNAWVAQNARIDNTNATLVALNNKLTSQQNIITALTNRIAALESGGNS